MSNITAHGFDILEPSTAPSAYPSSRGNIPVGSYQYCVSYQTHYGETLAGPLSPAVTLTTTGAITLTNIPVRPEGNVIARKIYRNAGSISELVATIPDNSTTTYIDTFSNATTPAPTASFASSVEIERGWIVNKRAPIQPYSTLACANPPSQCDQRSQFIFLSASGPGLGCILPPSIPELDGLLVTLTNSSPNDVTLHAGTGRTINGGITATLTAGSTVEYILAGDDFLPCGSTGGGPSGPPGPPSVITLVMDDNAPIPKYPSSSAEGVWHGTDARRATTTLYDTVIGNVNIVNPHRAIAFAGSTIVGSANTVNGKGVVCVGGSNTTPANGIVIGSLSTSSDGAVVVGNSAYAVGVHSVAIGKQAKTTDSGVSIGYSAGYTLTTGTSNVFIGYAAGVSSSTSSNNVCIGNTAGAYLTSGNNNVIIGNNTAGAVASTCSNVIVIGALAQPTGADNEITLGDANIDPLFGLRCNATSITSLSDARDKTNIRPLTNARRFIDALNPVMFDWNRRDKTLQGVTETGFIAQELAIAQADTNTHVPGLVQMDNPDKYFASYGKLLPHLVQAVRELSAEVASLRAKLPQ
jgi:Chaperone of endosialidase